MSAGTPSLPDPYKVEAGDTLSRIAEASGLPVSELGRLNELEASSRLTVGQALYLSPRTANGVTVQFLDALRHPISNLAYRLKFDDRSISGVTDQQGITAQQITQSPSSLCEISIQGADGRWRPCARTVSGVGHKFITLVSSALVVKGSTDRHPAGAPVQLGIEAAPGGQSAQKARPGEPSGQPSRNNPVVLTRKNKGPHGQSIIRIDVAFPPGLLDLFAGYTGGEISPAQWDEAAAKLQCETAVLKAFAEVESGSRAAFWRLNRGDGAVLPAILYERHYFSRLTARRYDHTHPDLSWRVGYRTRARLGKSDRRMHDGRVDANDIYANYASSYLRLINAFRLDPDAALKSCSWGKFQIMGANHALCGKDDVKEFVAAMADSERAQLDLLGQFVRRKPRRWRDASNKTLGKEISLWDAVKTKNWSAIAFNYNGPSYRTYRYDQRLKSAYEKHRV